jgi:hypothetical protein
MYLHKPFVQGEIPSPRRAHSMTLLKNYLVVFGGGDGSSYFNDVYFLDLGESIQWLLFYNQKE